MKYLVQVRDDVEAGDEKLKELESEMKDWGIFDTDFCLGDILEDEDETNNPPPKKKIAEWPAVEGEETIAEYIGQYKKACLSRKALLKSTRERLEKDNPDPKVYEPLGFPFEFVSYEGLTSTNSKRPWVPWRRTCTL